MERWTFTVGNDRKWIRFVPSFRGRGHAARQKMKVAYRKTIYQSPFQQGSRSEGMPSLDPRVPIGQDSGVGSLRHIRVLGDTSGWFARLTSK